MIKNSSIRKRMKEQLMRMVFYDVWEHMGEDTEGNPEVRRGDGKVLESVGAQRGGAIKLRFPDRLKSMELLLRLIAEEESGDVEITFSED